MNIEYVKGNAAKPDKGRGVKFIAHIVNDVGAWGKGFTASLDEVSSWPKEQYLNWRMVDGNPSFKLGNCYLCNLLGEDAPVLSPMVVHMLAQKGLRSKDNPVPFDIYSFYDCLTKLIGVMGQFGIDSSLHMPKVGSGLGGGDWQEIEKHINGVFGSSPFGVYVYEVEK